MYHHSAVYRKKRRNFPFIFMLGIILKLDLLLLSFIKTESLLLCFAINTRKLFGSVCMAYTHRVVSLPSKSVCSCSIYETNRLQLVVKIIIIHIKLLRKGGFCKGVFRCSVQFANNDNLNVAIIVVFKIRKKTRLSQQLSGAFESFLSSFHNFVPRKFYIYIL
jgi:hypothetical protein